MKALADQRYTRILEALKRNVQDSQFVCLRPGTRTSLQTFISRALALHDTYRNRVIHDPSVPTAPEQVKDGITHYRIRPDSLYWGRPLARSPVSLQELDVIAQTYRNLNAACRALNLRVSEECLHWGMTEELRTVVDHWLSDYEDFFAQLGE